MKIQFKSVALAALAVTLIVAAGCQKKAPKGAKELPSPHATSMPQHAQMNTGLTMNADGTMNIGPIKTKLPNGWKSVQPASSMRRAQFDVPAAPGDSQGGELTVFYFGPQAGGVEANISRWVAQFQQPGGQPLGGDAVERTDFTVSGMPITMVRFHGTMKPSSMPGMTPTPEHANWMNISGIVSTPEGPWFFKGTGPEKTMTSQIKNFESFFQGMTYTGSAQAHG